MTNLHSNFGKVKTIASITIGILLAGSYSQETRAWGGRGHDTICRTATFLVKDPTLKEYLTQKPQMMGHLCNVPDFYWKSLKGDDIALGNSSHFIDPEIFGLKVETIPANYSELLENYTGKPNQIKAGATVFSVPLEFGSSWWRVEQFMKRIEGRKAELEKATPPANRAEEQSEELAFNKLVFQMIVDMGLMGHFVGDASQPLHISANYDGWLNGHGGIHSYYEDAVVGQFDGDLEANVLKKARAMNKEKFLSAKNTIEKMRALSLLSERELEKVYKLDPLTKPSTLTEGQTKGLMIKTPAERKPAKDGFKVYKDLISTQLARSARLLAALWDEAYESAGKPKVTAFKSYKYPFT
ncbi:MAG TPA: hypothetical protein PLU50_03895, partial [Pseudobdellovibrionaceae bacterium]|nr:hypothetical protein [Pseudobdellovibrionaceae bacterium]